MKRIRRGFTLVEVTIYLALSGLLVVGVIAALSPSIGHQRFYDATQNFADFLRSVYSQVANPQSVDQNGSLGGGRSNYAIYGKLIVFGEKKGLDGETNVNQGVDPEQRIYVYDVVGNESGVLSGGSIINSLKAVNANVLVAEQIKSEYNNTITIKYSNIGLAGLVQEYIMRWGTAAEKTDVSGLARDEELKARWTGSILIVRHPSAGTISTLVSNSVIEVNEKAKGVAGLTERNDMPNLLVGELQNFKSSVIDFCINRDSSTLSTMSRWDVRIVEGAHNATDVNVLDLDGNTSCNSK